MSSATYITAQGSTGSLTHWVRPGIKPASSWMKDSFPLSHDRNPYNVLNWYKLQMIFHVFWSALPRFFLENIQRVGEPVVKGSVMVYDGIKKPWVHTHLYSWLYLCSWDLLFPHPPNIAVLPVYITGQLLWLRNMPLWITNHHKLYFYMITHDSDTFSNLTKEHIKKGALLIHLLPRMQFPHTQSTNASFVGILPNTIHLCMIFWECNI